MGEKTKKADKGIKEALINELKGNLFEYLVGLELSTIFALKDAYLKNLSADYLIKLKDYDGALRALDLELYQILSRYAKETAQFVAKGREGKQLVEIELVGKLVKKTHHQEEADLILTEDSGHKIYISLKLYKAGAFVNTKSAGLRSFIKKYFQHFSSAERLQLELNQKFELEHQVMLQMLNAKAGFAQTGRGLHPAWEERGLSLLPGKLPGELSEILSNCYYKISHSLHLVLSEFYQEDKEKFFRCLMALLGFSSERITQVLAYYQNNGAVKYGELYLIEHKASDVQLERLQIEKQKENLSSFCISMGQLTLQIRVKPMSSFVAPSFKINCSVKFH